MVDEEGNFAISTFLISIAVGAIIGLGMSYASDVVSNAKMDLNGLI